MSKNKVKLNSFPNFSRILYIILLIIFALFAFYLGYSLSLSTNFSRSIGTSSTYTNSFVPIPNTEESKLIEYQSFSDQESLKIPGFTNAILPLSLTKEYESRYDLQCTPQYKESSSNDYLATYTLSELPQPLKYSTSDGRVLRNNSVINTLNALNSFAFYDAHNSIDYPVSYVRYIRACSYISEYPSELTYSFMIYTPGVPYSNTRILLNNAPINVGIGCTMLFVSKDNELYSYCSWGDAGNTFNGIVKLDLINTSKGVGTVSTCTSEESDTLVCR